MEKENKFTSILLLSFLVHKAFEDNNNSSKDDILLMHVDGIVSEIIVDSSSCLSMKSLSLFISNEIRFEIQIIVYENKYFNF